MENNKNKQTEQKTSIPTEINKTKRAVVNLLEIILKIGG